MVSTTSLREYAASVLALNLPEQAEQAIARGVYDDERS